ncbi:hypothetical protein ACWC0C_07035 [Streptomyces sp. NPDC001709]
MPQPPDRCAALDLLGRAADVQALADARMMATTHGREIPPADDAAYWRARLCLAMRARVLWGQQ